ncbi:unnamed protein product [Cercopithifilaria johnstoni]|uniref:Tyrosine-protein phosphatase domain-containing protein n=1 Tax=Cercopithifilaria johnstoni TaxID=2874296 RepID=A0A8J2MR87_9BILA|nr:unnamed protein product [Cercopithifilaria johnstoni]
MNFKKENGILLKLSSEESPSLQRINADLSKEEVEKGETGKIMYAISSGSSRSMERLGDESADYDKKRPYYYNDLLDGIPESLQSIEEDLPQTRKESSRPNLCNQAYSESLKEKKLMMPITKRTPRPFCYDEFLDGVTESLISLAELKANEIKVTATSDSECPLTKLPSHMQKVSNDHGVKKAENIAENESEESGINMVQGMQIKVSNGNIWENALSAQKLVCGENVMDFTSNYIFSKKSLERAMKLEHKFLWKQQQHISDFCQSEAVDKGKNRSPNVVNFNEGAVRLLPTIMNDSRYIHASQINISYGNFIITQGPTKQSLIDFFRMLWQCHVLLVICLEPLTDQRTCYPYFSFKKQQVVKARERISLETREVIETPVANLFVYEAILTNMEIKDGGK